MPRDGEAIRRVGQMLRYWGPEGLLCVRWRLRIPSLASCSLMIDRPAPLRYSPDWEPHAAGPQDYGVYASRWPLGNRTLWTIVNRAGKNLSDARLVVEAAQATDDGSGLGFYYDCYHGVPLAPVRLEPEAMNATRVELSITIEAGGFACVLMQREAADERLDKHLKAMATLTAKPLSSFDDTWRYLAQRMTPIPKTPLATAPPAGTVLVPRATFSFTAHGLEIEGADGWGVDMQFPWESSPRREHHRELTLGPFYMDRHPVTCANYSTFLGHTGYVPRSPHNWLKNWNWTLGTPGGHGGHGQPPQLPSELAERPVTYVGLSEARKYCTWAGGRLPHAFEWQYAAQGLDNRSYPWGNQSDATRYPPTSSGRIYPGPTRVGAYSPQGQLSAAIAL